MKVLIADDDPVHIQLVSGRLKAEGFQVLVARDAMQVLMMAIRSRPSAILLDINMPGGPGLQTLRQLKASIVTNPIPVIVVSGSCNADLQKQLEELGIESFFAKPFDLAQVLPTLRRLLGRQEGVNGCRYHHAQRE
jgi:DNA-binding response OmpR family regulator